MSDRPRVDPIFRELRPKADSVVLHGYVGTGPRKVVRLYTDLTFTTYVDIAEADCAAHAEHPGGGTLITVSKKAALRPGRRGDRRTLKDLGKGSIVDSVAKGDVVPAEHFEVISPVVWSFWIFCSWWCDPNRREIPWAQGPGGDL